MIIPSSDLRRIRAEASQLYFRAANRDQGKGGIGLICKLRERVLVSSKEEFRKPYAKANLDFHLLRRGRLLKQLLNTTVESDGDAAVDALMQMHEALKSIGRFEAERPDLSSPVERMGVSKTGTEPLIHFALRHKFDQSMIRTINDFQSYFLPLSSELLLRPGCHSGWYKNSYTMHYSVFISGGELLGASAIGNSQLGELSIRVTKELYKDARPMPTTAHISFTKDGYAYCTGVAIYFNMGYLQTRFADSGQPPLHSLKAIVSDHGEKFGEFSSGLAASGAIGVERQANYEFSLERTGWAPQTAIKAHIWFSTPQQLEIMHTEQASFIEQFGAEGFAACEPTGPDGTSRLNLVFLAGKTDVGVTNLQGRFNLGAH